MNDFETIKTFDDYITASLAKQKLEDHSINCYLADENTIAMQWTLSNAVGGIKLRVPANEKERALKILDEIPKEIEIEIDHKIETDDEVICPNCQSNNTGTEKISKSVAGWTWLIIGFPISVNLIKSHRCFYCGHKWET